MIQPVHSTAFGRRCRTTDSERILGQIERGEVVAGPEGARIIAARAQDQYGDVWDRVWTATVTDLSETGEDCD